jgi:hypothetical protein
VEKILLGGKSRTHSQSQRLGGVLSSSPTPIAARDRQRQRLHSSAETARRRGVDRLHSHRGPNVSHNATDQKYGTSKERKEKQSKQERAQSRYERAGGKRRQRLSMDNIETYCSSTRSPYVVAQRWSHSHHPGKSNSSFVG